MFDRQLAGSMYSVPKKKCQSATGIPRPTVKIDPHPCESGIKKPSQQTKVTSHKAESGTKWFQLAITDLNSWNYNRYFNANALNYALKLCVKLLTEKNIVVGILDAKLE